MNFDPLLFLAEEDCSSFLHETPAVSSEIRDEDDELGTKQLNTAERKAIASESVTRFWLDELWVEIGLFIPTGGNEITLQTKEIEISSLHFRLL